MTKRTQGAKLGKLNEATRKAHASALASVMRERSRGNAQGAHLDKRTKRIQTRNAQTRFALRDWI